jgi:hypothetical protein
MTDNDIFRALVVLYIVTMICLIVWEGAQPMSSSDYATGYYKGIHAATKCRYDVCMCFIQAQNSSFTVRCNDVCDSDQQNECRKVCGC